MKRNYILLLICITTVAAHAQNFGRIWINKYYPVDASTQVTDMATDATGNSYITGYKTNSGAEYYENNFYLMKVNAAGVQEWIRYYSPIEDSIDEGKAVALDESGNVYVTLSRIDTFCNICTNNSKISDIITIKYDGAGNKLWENRYHHANYILATPSDIAVKNGVVFIAGNELQYNSITGIKENKLVAIRLSANTGKTAWVRRGDDAVGHSACFDIAGNIIVVGAYDPSNAYLAQKPLVVKFKPNGDTLWVKVFSEFNKNGRLYTVFTDAQNNIYTNGQSDTTTFFNVPRILTIKYNANGQLLWSRKEQARTTTLPHTYGDFTVDALANSYVTGYTDLSGVRDYLTSKYDANGNKLWTTITTAGETPTGVATDNAGNVAVTGSTYALPGPSYAFYTVILNSSGVEQVADLYKNGNKNNNFPAAITKDTSGNFYVTGGAGGAIATIKYGPEAIAKVISPVGVSIRQPLLLVAPNPVRDLLNISISDGGIAGEYEMAVINHSNQMLMKTKVNIAGGAMPTTMNVLSLLPGIYTLIMQNGQQTVQTKFIKIN